MGTGTVRYFMFHEVLGTLEALPSGFAQEKTKYVLYSTDFDKVLSMLNPKLDILTFDDGGISQYDAIRRANYYGFSTILFMPTQFIGKDHFLSDRDLRELTSCSLNKIGCHGHRHNMATFTPEELEEEIKSIVEQVNNRNYIDFQYLALPGGTLNMDFVNLYKKYVHRDVKVFHSCSSNLVVSKMFPYIDWCPRVQVLDSNIGKRGFTFCIRELKSITKQIYYGKVKRNNTRVI